MKKSVETRFFFHANAVALAAHIRRPEDSFIPAVASSCLPVTGGIGSADAPGASHGDLLSYGSASTRVFGDFVTKERAAEYTHGNHGANRLPTETVAEARLTSLRIANGGRLLEVEALEAKLSASSDRRGATQFRSLSAEFTGVRIDGVPLTVTTHCDLFAQHPTKERLAQAFAREQSFRDSYAEFFFSSSHANPRRRRLPEASGVLFGTIVSSLRWDGKPPEGAVIHRNKVEIANFGSIYFGEILIEEGFRRLTLLRFQLGSPIGGDGSVVEVQSNGSTWPPRKSSK